jgi:predicted GNAT family acetyltransferase
VTTSEAAEAIVVSDSQQKRQFEARIDGELVGHAVYLRRPGVIAFVHTEVENAWEGRGIGSTLIRVALDEARAKDLRVIAVCPFVASWIDRHPAYQDLLYVPASHVKD